MEEDGQSDAAIQLFSWRRIRQFLWRATFWRCPICGTRPIFIPLSKVRSFHDWLTPLDGCPVCGYAYDREPGYFLMSVWAIGYAASAAVGIAVYVYLQVWHSDWSLGATLLAVALPLPLVNVLFARHAKAYFLAIDHLFDPHSRANDEDDEWPGGDGHPPSEPPPAPRGVPVRADTGARGGGGSGDLPKEPAAARPADVSAEVR